MTPFLRVYLAGWIAFCTVAAVIAVRSVRIPWRDAARFLAVPWKLALFLPGIVFVTFAGRFTDDETWDVVNGGGMAILTVGTAWWSVGTAARVVRRLAPARELLVAIAVTLFSASWFYDGWLLIRDGAYSVRWEGNLFLSPTIYLCAGAIQNLELRDGKLAFGFTRPDWPRMAERSASWRLALAAVPFVLVAVWFLVGFVGWKLPGR